MRRLLLAVAIAGTLFSCSSNSAVATDNEETIGIWVTDFSGKPPFKRALRHLPAAEFALLEIEESSTETERVWRADYSGHPPFKRGYRDLPVVDASSLEIITEEEAEQNRNRNKSRFKRHR